MRGPVSVQLAGQALETSPMKTVGADNSLPRVGPDAACENWSIIPVTLL